MPGRLILPGRQFRSESVTGFPRNNPGRIIEQPAVALVSFPVGLQVQLGDGGNNGDNVTTVTSAGPLSNAYTTVLNSAGTFTLDDTHPLSGVTHPMKSVPSGSGTSYGVWAISALEWSTSVYVWLDGLPDVEIGLGWLGIGPTTRVVNLAILPTGKVITRNAASATAGSTFTNTIPFGEWIRLDWTGIVGTTTSNGSMSVAMYHGHDPIGSEIEEKAVLGTANTGTSVLTSARTPFRPSTSSQTITMWAAGPRVDDSVGSSANYLGPLSSTTTQDGVVDMVGGGGLTVTPSQTEPETLALTGAGTLAVTATDVISPAVTMAGAGDLTITGSTADLSLLADWDADTLLGTTGSAVTSWTDSIGGFIASQATGTKQPTLRTGTMNGHNLVEFDGSSDVLALTDGALNLAQNQPSLAIFVVFKLPATAVTGVREVFSLSSGTAAASARAALYTHGTTGKPMAAGRRLDADAFGSVEASTALATGAQGILVGRWLWTSSDLYVYLDGTTVASTLAFQTTGNTSNTISLSGAIGSRADALTTEMYSGSIARILVYTDVDDTKRNSIESALRTLYGLSAQTAVLTFTGAGTLAVAPDLTHPATVALAGAGTLAVTATDVVPQTLSMSGAGTMAVTASQTVTAAPTFAGTGSLTVTPTRVATAALAFAGAGAMAVAGTGTIPATVAMAGAGALAVTPSRTVPAAAAFAGVGTLAITSSQTDFAALAFAGVGALSVTGVRTTQATLAMAGAGTLSIASSLAVVGALAMAGTGALTVTAVVTTAGVLAMTGAGVLAITPTHMLTPAVAMVGTGSLTVVGAQAISVTVTMAGAGALAVTAVVGISVAVAMAGSGSLTVTATTTRTGVLAMAGSGTLSVTAVVVISATLAMTGSGTLSIAADQTLPAVIPFAGSSALLLTATGGLAQILLFAGSSSLVIATGQTLSPILAMVGAGTMAVTGAGATFAAVALIGIGVLTITPTDAISLGDSKSGALASGTVATVTLPTYNSTDYIVLILSRNQAQATPFTFSSPVSSITEIAQAGGNRRLTAMRVVPNGAGQTTFTMTATTSGVWSWWIGAYSGVGLTAAVAAATNSIGNSTTSTIEVPNAQLGYIAQGKELGLSAGGVNATATWTTDANTVYSTGTSANAGLLIRKAALTPGTQTFVPGNLDRGLGGTTRNESALSFVLQTTTPALPNLLTNGSFETFTGGIATGWADEHVTAGPFTYSSTVTGVVDGSTAQRIQYTGQAGDNGTTSKGEIYQSSIGGVSAGDILTFSIWCSGTWSNIYGIIGIEAFDSGAAYISEADVSITAMTGTPTKYSVAYVCPPGTSFVAVYFQFPGVAPTSSWDVTLDNAALLREVGAFVSMTGGGDLSVTPAVTASGSMAMAGAGDLTIASSSTVPAALAMVGTGALTITPQRIAVSPIAMAGSGILAIAPSRTVLPTVALVGVGALAVTTQVVVSVPVSLAGSSTLTITPSRIVFATPSFGGIGTLTVSVSGAQSGTLTMTGAGTLAVTPLLAHLTTVAFAGTGALSVTASTTGATTLAFAGDGTLAVSILVAQFAVLTFTGTGALTLTPELVITSTLVIAGLGTLTITGTAAGITGVNMVGAGGLTITVVITTYGTLLLVGNGVFTIVARVVGATAPVISPVQVFPGRVLGPQVGAPAWRTTRTVGRPTTGTTIGAPQAQPVAVGAPTSDSQVRVGPPQAMSEG